MPPRAYRRKRISGKIRLSHSIGLYGPGSIITFRTAGKDGGPVSLIVSGTDQWNPAVKRYKKHRKLYLERLAVSLSRKLQQDKSFNKRLGGKINIEYFVKPPEYDEDMLDSYASPIGSGVQHGYRFPRWLQCPKCNTIKTWPWKKNSRIDALDVSLWCDNDKCNDSGKIHTVPVRFLVTCEKGHIADFPWADWFARQSGGKHGCLRPEFELKSKTLLSLEGLKLKCRNCKKSVTMERVFGKDSLKGLKCRGSQYWIHPKKTEDCKCTPRAIQAGASNVYFPATASAIDIPPWSVNIKKKYGMPLERFIDLKKKNRDSDIEALIRVTSEGAFPDDMKPEKQEEKIEENIKRVNFYIDEAEKNNTGNLELDEYRSFVYESDSTEKDDEENNFQKKRQVVPDYLSDHISLLQKIVRLREVRALYGFSRLEQPSEEKQNLCPLSSQPEKWLPASEVKGEGFFIRLNEKKLKIWEAQKGLRKYNQKIRDITPRFVLVHTLAHLIMRYISLECGYATSAIKEKIYVNREPGDEKMEGLLIYTSSSDSGGTLGGLARLADPEEFSRILTRALETSRWCSQDPLCIKGLINDPLESVNYAACHSCAMIAETSCTEHNRLLDRSLLFGDEANEIQGFFPENFFTKNSN